MSRCFPYNPLPGCEERVALIEQIKLQKPEKVDEKKQKRDRKHDKAHGVSNEVAEDAKHGHLKRVAEDAKHGHLKRKHGVRNHVDKKGEVYTVAKSDESEQLEKSGLTEEHDLHYASSTRGQDSPDSYRYSKKRKTEVPAPECNRISHGSLLLRIKLPSFKPKEPELPAHLPVPAEPPCFSGRVETADTQEQHPEGLTHHDDQNWRCPIDEANASESFCGGKKIT